MSAGLGASARRAPLFLVLALVAAAWPAVPRSQEPEPQVFRSRANLVVLHVNVFDGRSDAVPGLPREAFRVTEDGVPQTVTFFSNDDLPVAVGLLIDNSSSMLTRRGMVLAGTQAFAASSHPEDEVFTLLFNEEVRLGLPDGQLFTKSPGMIQASLLRVPPGGRTALHDAVVAGLDHLRHATHQKQVLIALTDGEDNASRRSRREMLDQAARGNALIYTISTADLDSNVGDHGVLKRLSALTGGVTYRPDTEREVVASFTEIAGNIRRGYTLGYVPTNAASDDRFRRVSVSARVPGRRGLTVNARDGYVASDDSASH